MNPIWISPTSDNNLEPDLLIGFDEFMITADFDVGIDSSYLDGEERRN